MTKRRHGVHSMVFLVVKYTLQYSTTSSYYLLADGAFILLRLRGCPAAAGLGLPCRLPCACAVRWLVGGGELSPLRQILTSLSLFLLVFLAGW